MRLLTKDGQPGPITEWPLAPTVLVPCDGDAAEPGAGQTLRPTPAPGLRPGRRERAFGSMAKSESKIT
jgi:hypothetical protein